MRFSLSKSILLLTCTLTLDGLFASPPSAFAGNEVTVSIHNQSNMRLHIRAMGSVEVGQIPPGKWMHISLPKKVRYKGTYVYTRQLMAYGGGYWQADSSGWTRYRNLKTCARRTFKQKGGTFIWELTGTVKRCEPTGYRQ